MSQEQPTTIYLPPPITEGEISLEEAVARRRSVRKFTADLVSQSQLSQILWAAQGVSNGQWQHRTTPSAGATYPLEIFVACGRGCIEGMDEGMYHHVTADHCLTLLHKEDMRPGLAEAALSQECIREAPLNIVVCALYQRTAFSYGQRGERYVHIEAGHVGQNIYLQAAALGLGTVAIGAFNDERVGEVLKLDKQYQPLYIMPVGSPADA